MNGVDVGFLFFVIGAILLAGAVGGLLAAAGSCMAWGIIIVVTERFL